MMKLMNYMNLNQHPVQLSFRKDRTHEFAEIYHAHQGMEILYVHEGHGHVIVERQIFELSPGTMFLFRPYQLHRVKMTDLALHPYVRTLFVFEPSVLEAVLQPFANLLAFFRMLWKDPAASPVLMGPGRAEMEAWFRLHAESLQTSASESLLEDQLLFLVSLIQRLRTSWSFDSTEIGGPSRPRTSSTAEAIMEWIEAHYGEPFELDRLAQHVHLTPNHVSALFRRSVGSSITEYITARRIRQACWLLRTTDQPVRAIGEAVGLSNFSYFCQAFKKHVGLSPHRYRNAR